MVGMRPPRAAVATTCNRCHQPDGVAPEGDRPARARAFLDALQGVRANLDAVHAFTGFDAGAAGVADARTRVAALLDYVISAPLQ